MIYRKLANFPARSFSVIGEVAFTTSDDAVTEIKLQLANDLLIRPNGVISGFTFLDIIPQGTYQKTYSIRIPSTLLNFVNDTGGLLTFINDSGLPLYFNIVQSYYVDCITDEPAQVNDYTFNGTGLSQFYINTPAAVAQAVKTRLELVQGEWFLDINAGTPYNSQILGAGKISSYDQAIREVILNTVGVTEIVENLYSSFVDPITRAASVQCTINTLYGQASVSAIL